MGEGTLAISKGMNEITTLDDWEKHGHPKSAVQWADGRSAKEAAIAWLASAPANLPPEVSLALAKHPDFGPVLTWEAEPEARLRFDKFPGEPRNTDLLVKAEDAHGQYIIAVEAKADETFGGTVAQTRAAAGIRLKGNPRSNGVTRIDQLITAFFSPQPNDEPPIESLRYQLLTACAGALCEAERRNVRIFGRIEGYWFRRRGYNRLRPTSGSRTEWKKL